MNVPGLPGTPATQSLARDWPLERPPEPEASRGTRPEPAPADARARPQAADDGAAAAAAPPPGTDPALWNVLTTEERSFYARVRKLGPLTYGPDRTPALPEPLPRGGRIDRTV